MSNDQTITDLIIKMSEQINGRLNINENKISLLRDELSILDNQIVIDLIIKMSEQINGRLNANENNINQLRQQIDNKISVELINYYVNSLEYRSLVVSKLNQFMLGIKPIVTEHALIRLGESTDGGYLLPDDLKGITACFSPGVDTNASFELSLTKRGIPCYLLDASVDSPPYSNKLFDFEKKFLGPKSQGKFIDLETWVNTKMPNKSDFLMQMDIEGDEYAVLFEAKIETLRKFRILIIEFHFLNYLTDLRGFEMINTVFSKLINEFAILHIHPNNCLPATEFESLVIPQAMEFTFLRKDRFSKSRPQLIFPHELDKPNTPNNEDIILPECWYK